MNYEEIRTLCHRFLIELSVLEWDDLVGLSDSYDIVLLYDRYKILFDEETISQIKEYRAENQDDERRNRSLLAILISHRLDQQISHASEAIAACESRLTVEFEGQSLAFRNIHPTMLREPDRSKRERLYALKCSLYQEEVLPLKRVLLENLIKASQNLGYSSYRHVCESLQSQRFEPLREMTGQLLRNTEELYRKYLDKYLQSTLGLSTEEASLIDVLMLRRGKPCDRFFVKDQLVEIARETIRGLGFDLASQTNILLDYEERRKKLPFPCTVSVDPPDDVRLSIYPTGGPEDYEGFLHELGHCEHSANMDPNLSFEHKQMGDRGFSEGIGILFQRLTINRDWLKTFIDRRAHAEHLKFSYFFRLWSIRRLVSLFTFQVHLFDATDLQGLEDRYADIMRSGLVVALPSTMYLEFDLDFYVAGYIRATLFEVQLRSYLENTYGSDWWRKRACGKLLQDLFRAGRKYSAEEVLSMLGLGELSPVAFLEDISSVLR